MPRFESPLTTTHLPPMPARVGACRLGIVRLGFIPRETDTLTIPASGDAVYYAYREVIPTDHSHTEVPQ